jgi:hypothetical protein
METALTNTKPLMKKLRTDYIWGIAAAILLRNFSVFEYAI